MRYVVGVLAVLAIGCASEVPTEPAACSTDLNIRCEYDETDLSTRTGIHCRDRASGTICGGGGFACVDSVAVCGDWGDAVCVTLPVAEYDEWASTRPLSCE